MEILANGKIVEGQGKVNGTSKTLFLPRVVVLYFLGCNTNNLYQFGEFILPNKKIAQHGYGLTDYPFQGSQNNPADAGGSRLHN